MPESEVNQRIMQEFIEEAFQEEKRFITERRELVLDALGCTEREVAIGRAVLMLPRWIQQKFFPKRW